MANKKLFNSLASNSKNVIKPVNTVNNAGGVAYNMSDKAALAQLALTGTFNGTYYVTEQDQLVKILELAGKCELEYVAKLAVYSRQHGLMKDVPAVLAAFVAGKDSKLLGKIFSRVVDSPKMLRNFVQVVRSGVTGRKSLGSAPKRMIQDYLESLTDEQLFKADVGNSPSLQDIVKMVHPKPRNKHRNALYGYLLNKDYNKEEILPLVSEFESFKKDMTRSIPDVPFQMLTALNLNDGHWKELSKRMTWNQMRMNLNTMTRHNVLTDSSVEQEVANKLSNPEQVKRAKVFPYQLFTTFKFAEGISSKLQIAIQKAAEVSLDNVPEIKGKVYVLPDVSGSMSSPITGNRGTVSTKMRCIDIAALVSAAMLRKNPEAQVIPFDTRVHATNSLNPLDSIMTNAEKLSKFGGGGTNCALPLAHLNAKGAKGDLVIYVSDNESWVDTKSAGYYRSNGTAVMEEWNKFKARNPNAKLVCIDITPNSTVQAHDRDDILNVGGFSDQVFEVISLFLERGNNKDLWIKTIESVSL